MRVCKVCGCGEFLPVDTFNENSIIECEECGTEYNVNEHGMVDELLPTKEEFENKIRKEKLERIMK